MSSLHRVPPDEPATTLTNPNVRFALGVFQLPAALLQRFRLVSQLPKQGGEAVLLLVRPACDPTATPAAENGDSSIAGASAEQDTYVLKVYSRELGLSADVLQLIRTATTEHVPALHDFGTEQGVGYELLEFVQGGDLDEYVRQHGLLDEETAALVIAELTAAIECIHNLGPVPLAHGDLKPANVLIRTENPLDLVLADFGMATLHHDQYSQVRGTRRWSDPRAHTGLINAEGDWWSLGAIAFWLRTGQPLMAELTEVAAVDYLRERNVDLSALPGSDRHDWDLLCRGLLVRDAFERWGSSQVREWLTGGSPAVGAQWDEPMPIVIQAPEPTDPITFGGRTYQDLADLGLALADDWDESRALVAQRRDDLVTVLAEHGRETKDLDLAQDLAELLDAQESVDLRLSRLIRRLAPDAPPVYRSWAIDAKSLAGLADQGAANPDSPSASAITRLYSEHILAAWDYPGDASGELDDRWHALVEQWTQQVREHSEEPSEALVRRARATILLALLRPSQARDLTSRARDEATRRARSIGWFDDLSDRIGFDPGTDYAVVCLASQALLQADAADQADRDARQRQAVERAADSRIRIPRTRRILGWCVLAQVLLLALAAWLRVLAPRSWLGLTPRQGLAWWSEEIPSRVANWVTWWTDPWTILPLFAISALLYARARSDGPGGTVSRHPLERRAMQAAIAVTCLLVPPLIPLGLIGWWRGLQFHSPDALRGRDPLRTLSIGGGLAATTLALGLLVGVWPSELALSVSPAYQEWASVENVQTALAGPITAVGQVGGGIEAHGWAIAVTLLVCLSGPVLIGLASRAYFVWARAIRRGMGALVLVGLLAVGQLPFAYLPLRWANVLGVAAVLWVGWVVMRGGTTVGPYRPDQDGGDS